MAEYLERRDLDGVYFRVERDGRWQSVCFTDLTQGERRRVLEGRSAEWCGELALLMALRLREIGDVLDLTCVEPEE